MRPLSDEHERGALMGVHLGQWLGFFNDISLDLIMK
jgi:hypothetical protein